MAKRQPVAVVVLPEAEVELKQLVARHSTPQQIALRAKIILLAKAQVNNSQIARQLNVPIEVPRLWRNRWQSLAAVPLSELSVQERLTDAPRSGKPPRLTPQQVCQIIALGCEQPLDAAQRPISHWTGREIADEIKRRGTVDQLSARHAARLFKKNEI
jgi:putative transposase